MRRERQKWNQRRLIRWAVPVALATLLVIGSALIISPPTQDAVTIDIATDPPEATVQIDGITIGQTPLSTIVPDGEHELIIFKPGFKILDRKIYADPSALPQNSNNRYTFGLIPTGETLSMAEKSRRVISLERLTEEAFKRGDYVAPENDNAWYYLNKLQELDSTVPFINEMRQRIRRVLKQQAEMTHRRNDLG